MFVNVCPSGMTRAAPEIVWQIVTTPGRFGEWTDADFVSADPPGPARPGQVIHLGASGLGRVWPMTIEVGKMDTASHRWIDLVARLPFQIRVDEHLTLTATPEGGTLVRFN